MRSLAVIVLLLGCGSASSAPTPPAPVRPVTIAPRSEPIAAPDGYVEMRATRVAPIGESAAVLLVDEDEQIALPIFIGGTEGASIDYRMRAEKPPRPLTHDLLESVVKRLNGTLVKVHVDALRDGVFHGSVFIRANGRVMRIDARPSDAIALAIGGRVPIYVAKAVLDEAGMDMNEIRRHLQQGAPTITS